MPSQTGGSVGQLTQGMNQRVYGDETPSIAACVAYRNKYPNYDSDDPRIVTVMIVRPPSLAAEGNEIFPVKDFAQFYVTGWGDIGGADCPLTDSLNEEVDDGEIVGYFIKHVRPNDGTVYGGGTCNANQLGGCVPVMTK